MSVCRRNARKSAPSVARESSCGSSEPKVVQNSYSEQAFGKISLRPLMVGLFFQRHCPQAMKGDDE